MPTKFFGKVKNGRDYTRMRVRERDNFTCQNCKKIRTPIQAHRQKRHMFDVHHLNGLCGKKSKGYDKIGDIKNLITLCHKCHYNHHQFSQKLF